MAECQQEDIYGIWLVGPPAHFLCDVCCQLLCHHKYTQIPSTGKQQSMLIKCGTFSYTKSFNSILLIIVT